MKYDIPTPHQIKRRRKWRHYLRGTAVKVAPKETKGPFGQAPYFFLDGDWKGQIVLCRPDKFE